MNSLVNYQWLQALNTHWSVSCMEGMDISLNGSNRRKTTVLSIRRLILLRGIISMINLTLESSNFEQHNDTAVF